MLLAASTERSTQGARRVSSTVFGERSELRIQRSRAVRVMCRFLPVHDVGPEEEVVPSGVVVFEVILGVSRRV